LFDGPASLRLDAGKWVFEGRVWRRQRRGSLIVEDTDGLLCWGRRRAEPPRGLPVVSRLSGRYLPLNPRVERFGVAHGLPPTGVSVSGWRQPYFLSTETFSSTGRNPIRA
jgi:hypothetical protein